MPDKKTTKELVEQRPTPDDLYTLPRTPLVVIVDNVRSLDNVGLIFRLCELARVEKLYLTGYTGHPKQENDDRADWLVERHNRRIQKTAVYAVPYQPWEFHPDPLPLIENLKQKGYAIVSLEQTKTSIPYHTATYSLPMALIVGHERQGIRQELLDASDMTIEIPILGLGNSHNVATATGILLYHILEKTKKI